MGREIRRVPRNWSHPKGENPYTGKLEYQPLYDRSYKEVIDEWIENHRLWEEGRHPDQAKYPDDAANCRYYAQWNGNAPSVEYYRPNWSEEEATWWQVYETVTEGTPVTPPFPTEEDLIRYLSTQGTMRDAPWNLAAAERFVRGDQCMPTGIIAPDGQLVDQTQ